MAGMNTCVAAVTDEEILQMFTFLECVVLSSSLYMTIQLFSSIPENIGF